MHFDDSVNYGYLPPLDFEDYDLPSRDGIALIVGQEQ